MAVGITSLHPCLGWGNACDPRAVQLQTSHLTSLRNSRASAGFEVTALPLLPQQRGRSLVSICPHPTRQLPVVTSYPYISLRWPQQTQGKENGVWVCLYVCRGKGRSSSFPRDSDGSSSSSQAGTAIWVTLALCEGIRAPSHQELCCQTLLHLPRHSS